MLLEVSWAYTAPIGGEFFFPPSQRGQFGQHMAKGVLIGLLHITGSHMLKPDFFSLTGLAVCTPFLSSARMQLLLEAGVPLGFLIFQLSDFSPAATLYFQLKEALYLSVYVLESWSDL